MMCFHIFLTFSIFLPLLLLVMIIKKHEENSLPPAPIRFPIIGNLHQLSQPIHHSLQRLSEKHGPLMFLQLGSDPALVVSSTAMAKEVLKTHDMVFANRPVIYAANKLSYNRSNISLAPYGQIWRELRKIAVIDLLSTKRVQTFEHVRKEEVALMIRTVTNSSSTSAPINLSELMFLLVNNVVLRAVFSQKGNNYGEENQMSEFNKIVHETQNLVGVVNIADSFPWMGWLNKLNGFEPRLDKNFRELDSFYDKVIQEHREHLRTKHEDLVDVLLRVQNDPNQEIRLTNDQIKGVLTDMFIAGTDTSATTLVWTMTELIKNPSVMRKAQEEVREIVKDNVKESDLPKLEYLKMIVKEVLRLHPPIPLLLPHESTEKCSIGCYKIPAKTRVLINVTAIGRDPENWENPEEFKPERFLNSSVDFRGQHFELLPFGAGRRSCPGTSFATVIIELALTNLLFRFNWKLPDGMSAENVDTEETLGTAVHKKTPLCLVAFAPYKLDSNSN